MITVTLLDSQWFLQIPYVKGPDFNAAAIAAFRKLWNGSPELLSALNSASSKNQDDFRLLTDYNQKYLAETCNYFTQDMPVFGINFSDDIIAFEITGLIDAGQFSFNRPEKVVTLNPTEFLNKDVFVMSKLALKKRAQKMAGAIVQQTQGLSSFKEILIAEEYAENLILDTLDSMRKRDSINNFISFPTLQLYQMERDAAASGFEYVDMHIEYSSLFPVRALFKKGAKISEIRAMLDMMKDVSTFESPVDIMKNRFNYTSNENAGTRETQTEG